MRWAKTLVSTLQFVPQCSPAGHVAARHMFDVDWCGMIKVPYCHTKPVRYAWGSTAPPPSGGPRLTRCLCYPTGYTPYSRITVPSPMSIGQIALQLHVVVTE